MCPQFPRKTGISAVWLLPGKTGISALSAFPGKLGISAYNYCAYSNRRPWCVSGTQGVYLLFNTHLDEQFDIRRLKESWKTKEVMQRNTKIP